MTIESVLERAREETVPEGKIEIEVESDEFDVIEKTEFTEEEEVDAKTESIPNADFDAIMKEVRKELDEIREQRKAIAEERDALQKEREESAELATLIKEGRVLSRKRREVIKAAVSALEAVLREDTRGSEEDEEASLRNDEGKQFVEIEDTKKPEATVDVVDTQKEEKNDLTPEQIGEIVEVAITKALSEGKIADAIKDGQLLAIKKLTGAVE